MAVANANWELADYLLDRGADPNVAGAGWNALHQLVRTRRMNTGFGFPGPIPSGSVDSIDVLQKMIAVGGDVNARMTTNGMKDGQRNRLNRLGATPLLPGRQGDRHRGDARAAGRGRRRDDTERRRHDAADGRVRGRHLEPGRGRRIAAGARKTRSWRP